MNPYRCEVLADSVNPAGVRLTTLLVRFPRIVLAEFNTHRMLSRNSASSRAIPVEKRIAAVRAEPFVPAAFATNQRGMQAGALLDDDAQAAARDRWLIACEEACYSAERLAKQGVHKQWANRLIETFSWHEVIVTATDWSNFFHLRISEHAQPEIRAAAEAMKKAMDASTPQPLAVGEWHLPLVLEEDCEDAMGPLAPNPQTGEPDNAAWGFLSKLSVARCARVSYLTHEGKRDVEADIRLHDQLLANGHMSPFEHAARAEGDSVYRGNFRGWTQYRKTIPREADRMAPVVEAAGPVADDATGYNVAPARYSAHGRETIDRIRDSMTDAEFVAYCRGTALKYLDRAGLKGSADEDLKKANWYTQMANHVAHGAADPRAYRAGFQPYTRSSR